MYNILLYILILENKDDFYFDSLGELFCSDIGLESNWFLFIYVILKFFICLYGFLKIIVYEIVFKWYNYKY